MVIILIKYKWESVFFKELFKMAENIEEIAGLIENLKRENKNSNEDFINILNDISGKINSIQNNNGELDSVISDIQRTLNSKIQMDDTKLNELDATLDKLKNAIYSSTDYSELTEEVKTLAENFKSGFNSVISFANKDADAKNILMDRIQALENAVKDGVMVEALKQRTDDLVKGYENFISDSNLRHGNMVSALVDLKNKIDDYASKSNYALATIEHSMNDTTSKIMNLESTVSSNLGNVNSKLYSLGDDLQKILNDSFDHLKYLSSNMSEAMNSSSLDFKTTIEALKANVLSFSDNLRDEFNALTTRINNKIDDVHEEDALIDKDTLNKVKELEDTLLSKASEYEINLSDKFSILSSFVNTLNETIIAAKTENHEFLSSKLEELDSEIKTFSNNLEQLIANSAEEVKTISGSITQNSEEIINQLRSSNIEEISSIKDDLLISSGNNFSAIVEKIQGIENNIEDFKATTAEKLTEYLKALQEMFVDFSGDINISADNSEILEKLNNLEILMSRFDIEKNDNFNHLQVLIENNKNAIEDLKNNTQNSQVFENLKAVIESHSSNKDEQLEQIRTTVDSYQNTVERISSNIQALSENTLKEISELKVLAENTLNHSPEADTHKNMLEQLSTDIKIQAGNTLSELSEIKNLASEALQNNLVEKLAFEIQTQSEATMNKLEELKAQISNVSHDKSETSAYSNSVDKLSVDFKNQIGNTLNEITELLGGKVGDCKDTIVEEANAIKSSIGAIKDSLVELSPIIEINEISSKLSNIEHQFAEAFENYDLSLSILNVRLNEYTESLANSKGFSTSDMTNYEAEFDEIRNKFEEMAEKMSNLVGNSGLIEILANIRQQFNVVENTVKSEKESSVSEIRTTLDEVVSIINNNLYLIGQNIEAIYAKQSEVSENIINSLNNNLDSIKLNINNLIDNIEESVETRILAIVKDFEPLKDAINNYTKTDFSEIVSEIKESVELSYVNLTNEIKNKLGDTDTLDNVEKKYQVSVDHFDVLEDILQNSIQSSIDSINNTLLNIHSTTQNDSAILEDIQSGFQTDLMMLEKKVQEYSNSTNETITTQFEEIKEILNNSAGATPEDIKNIIAPFFDNDELIETIRTVNKSLADKITELKQDGDIAAQEVNEVVNAIKTTVNDTVALINDKFENSGEKANKILENLDAMNEKFEVLIMASNDDTVKNAVAEISEKTKDTVKNITQVIDTLTRIDVKTTTDLEYFRAMIEDMAVTTDDISSKIAILDEINAKLDDEKKVNDGSDVSVPVEEIRLKVEGLRKNINDILGFEVILRELILKLDILATDSNNEEILDEIDIIKNAVLDYRNRFEKSDKNIEILANLTKTIDSKLDIIAQDDNEDVLLDIADMKEHFGRVEYKIDCLSQLSYDQLKPEIDNIKGDLKNILDKASEDNKLSITNSEELRNDLSNVQKDLQMLANRIDVIAQTDNNDEIFDEISQLQESITTIGSKLDILASSSENDDVIISELEQVQEDVQTLTRKFDLELKSNENLFGADISDIKYNMKEIYSKLDEINPEAAEELSSKVDELHSNIDSVKNTLSDAISNQDYVDKESFKNKFDELHSNIDSVKNTLSDAISNQDYVDKESFKNKFDELKNQLISTESNLEEYSRTLDYKLDEISQFNGVYDKLNDIKSNISDGGIQLNDLVKELNTKVDILAMSDDSALIDEISEIKQIIESQIDAIRQSSLEEINQNSNEIKNVISELERIDDTIKGIDLNGSTAEIKNTVISALESITFGKETEKIKDFVKERTNEIQHLLIEVRNQLSAISNSGDDMDLYTYTMQDVESDIAKLRLVVNDMSAKVGDNEISVVSTNLNKMTRSIDNLQQAIAASGFDRESSENLGEQVTSISSRLNQLILAQQEIDKDEQLRNSVISKNLQKTISEINSKLEYSSNIITILKNVMMYLGEWMDGTTDTLSAIYDKCDIVDSIDKIQDAINSSVHLCNSGLEKMQEVSASRLENMQEIIISKLENIQEVIDSRLDNIQEVTDSRLENIENTYENKLAKQEARLDRIEKQLDKICEILESSSNDTVTNGRMDDIEEKLIRLNNNIEKLTAYVE